jgi:hypothetical protein
VTRSALLRCYPARWRERYGDEFAAILDERPLGPFDVADILLGALDAHLHLRGLGAASEHGRGFAMSLRIGGLAAIAGGSLWAFAVIGAALFNDAGGSKMWGLLLAVAMVALLGALVGLSAFQARRYPKLTWIAFAVPALGAFVALVGLVGMSTTNSDAPIIADLSPWAVWIMGTATLLLGSALFAVATWLTGTLSRRAAALLVACAAFLPPVFAIGSGGGGPEFLAPVLMVGMTLSFGIGWTWLGVSALRTDGRRPRIGAGSAAA